MVNVYNLPFKTSIPAYFCTEPNTKCTVKDVYLRPLVKCGSADLRIFKRVKCGGFADFFADVTGKMRMRTQYYKFKNT